MSKKNYVYALNASLSRGGLRRLLLTDRYAVANWRTTFKAIPVKVDLRETGFYGDVQDQGNLETSIGISLVKGCLEYAAKKDFNYNHSLSSIYVYRKDRFGFFTDPIHTVTSMMDAIEVMIYQGCCSESFDSYDYSTFSYRETPQLDTLASPMRLKRAYRIKSIKEIKRCLAEGYPVASLFQVFPSMFNIFVYRSGSILLPDTSEVSLGRHAMTIVGYDDNLEHFIVRNSWSKSWGEYGYGKLPYSAFKRMHLESYSLRL